MKKLEGALLAIAGMLYGSMAHAADVPFDVAAPTFDWTTLGAIAVSMLTVGVGMALFRRAKGVMRVVVGTGVGSGLMAASAYAVDVPFTVTAPTFDWTVLGAIAVSMLTVGVGMALFRRAKGVMR